MKNIWVKIGLGAGGIFAVGLALVSLIKFGKSKVHEFADSDAPIRIPLMGIVPFQVADQRLGDIRHLTLLRDAPKHLTGVEIEARLSDSASLDALKDCAFLSLNDANLNEHSRFHCITDTAGLGDFGSVEVVHMQGGEPTTLVRTLYLPQSVMEDLQNSMGSGPRDSDSMSAEQWRAFGDSMQRWGDSVGNSAVIQAEIARQQARVAVEVARSEGRGPRRVTVNAPLPPHAPTAPVPAPSKVLVFGNGAFDLEINDITRRHLVSRTGLTAPFEVAWPAGAVEAIITIKRQDDAHPLRGELMVAGAHSGTGTTAAGAGGTNRIRLRFGPMGYSANGS